MLTEGWDVPNVFQIVPSEERAFNSKLLISQVIGRGLRVPEEYKGEELHVKVLNHTKFSENIIHLVDEVLEREEKIYSYPVAEKFEHSFPVYNLIYAEETLTIDKEKIGEYSFEKLKKDWVKLPAELGEEDIEVTYGRLWSESEINEKYLIQKEFEDIEELAQRIHNWIRNWDTELETSYADEYDQKTIKDIIQKSLKKAGITNITKETATKFLQAFGTLKRFGNKNVRYSKTPKDLEVLDSANITKSGMSLSSVRKQKGYIFYDDKSATCSEPEDVENLKLLDEEIGRRFLIHIPNSFLFKTPFNLIHTVSNPEKEFITHLTKEENEEYIDAFIKSKDRGFYDFEYTWRKWEHHTTEHFNPDFFIKSWKTILVVEIKWSESEKQYSSDFIKNRAKYQQAKKHFKALNVFLKDKWIDFQYYFHFCSPKDFKAFFKYLQNGNIENYSSRLDVQYETSEESDIEIRSAEYFNNSELTKVFWDTWDKLEENSRIFLITAEKNYFDNNDNNSYSFSGWELIKTFELELKWKLFDKIRDEESVSYEAMDEENEKDGKQKNQKLIDFFNYKNDFLDLGSMENALKYNTVIKNYIKEHIPSGNTLIYSNVVNWELIKWHKFDSLPKDSSDDFPNVIALLRLKYRNESAHGDKTISKAEFEELRNLLIFGEWILVKFVEKVL